MNELTQLIEAEKKAQDLFDAIVQNKLISAGKSEKQLNTEIYTIATKLFGIKKFWHKRIVRSGKNTLLPYRENPPDLTIKDDDILFFDFGPVFEEWEADIGKTYVLGNNPRKLKLKHDVENAWQEGRDFFVQNYSRLTGTLFYEFTTTLAKKYGWEYGNEHCGHLIGKFPHEKIVGEEVINYLHPNNHHLLSEKDKNGNQRYWIYEIHFIDSVNEIGAFHEQLVY
jgi:Xaa-Pro aminopeptidase